ncbi:MAG: hypothetical protein HC836_31540 [Richelia sp. RM2_1_2]|nr:hypothetical protein [Richelia sp. SM2_1_7]NJO62599.1 hypothetical protein [Richelia sp. RM2_1_2]
MKLFNFLKPKPTIESYGQPSEVSPEQVQSLMEWLFASLMAAGHEGRSHLIWYDNNNPEPSLEKVVKKLIRSDEPIFLYRYGSRSIPAPQGYYWRMMDEHPSMRIYQLETRE